MRNLVFLNGKSRTPFMLPQTSSNVQSRADNLAFEVSHWEVVINPGRSHLQEIKLETARATATQPLIWRAAVKVKMLCQ